MTPLELHNIIPEMFFRRKKKVEPPEKISIKGQWEKCPGCSELIFSPHLEENLFVCTNCGYHFRITAKKYIQILLDDGKFEKEIGTDLKTPDPLNFPGYMEKVENTKKKTGIPESALAGTGKMNGYSVVLFITDFNFFAGSMGAVLGEKFVRASKIAIENRFPLVSLTASGGGARMHEGIISLMQMAKTTVAVNELNDAGLPYITILADPTMGGVMASFASLGDIMIAEPGALLGFAGPRVIQNTIKQELPPGFQRSEFLLEHGMVDMVVPRKELKSTITRIFDLLGVLKNGRS